MIAVERTSAAEPALDDAPLQRDERLGERLLCILKQRCHALLVDIHQHGQDILYEVGRTPERERDLHALEVAFERFLASATWPVCMPALNALSAVVERLMLREAQRDQAKGRTRHG